MNYNLSKSQWNSLSKKQKGNYLTNLTKEFKDLILLINRANINMSKIANSINKHKLYKIYWDEEETTSKSSYLEQAGIPLNKKEFNKYLARHKLIEKGVPDEAIVKLGIGKINILNTLGDELNGEWIEKALALSQSDLRREADEFKGKYKKANECEHKNIKLYSKQKYQCKDCGEIFTENPNKHKCDKDASKNN